MKKIKINTNYKGDSNNPWDMEKQFLARQLTQPKLCKLCGKPIVPSATDENGAVNYNLNWELENLAHWKCAAKYIREHPDD